MLPQGKNECSLQHHQPGIVDFNAVWIHWIIQLETSPPPLFIEQCTWEKAVISLPLVQV